MTDMKPWYQSRTIWGALVAILASIMQFSGVMMSESEQTQIADAIVTMMGTVGGLLALYGRVSASAAIRKE